mgnify:CR=1 FL=1
MDLSKQNMKHVFFMLIVSKKHQILTAIKGNADEMSITEHCLLIDIKNLILPNLLGDA